MQAQNTNPKPTAADLQAAEAGGWEYDLSMAAANAYAVYDRLTMRIVSNLRIDRI